MTEYAENTRPRPGDGENRTTNDEQRLHVVIGIPCLLLGGTEMQTLMVVKALRKEGFGGRCSLLRPEGYAGQEGCREEKDCLRCVALPATHDARRTTSNEQRQTNNERRKTRGFRATVVCYFEHDAGMVEEFRKAGAEVVLLDLKRTVSTIALIRKLRAVFSGLKPDIVHIQYMAPGLLPIIAARLGGIRRLIATVHQPGTPYGWLPHLFLRIGAMLCGQFICVSAAAEKSWFGVRRCGLSECRKDEIGSPRSSFRVPTCHSSRHLTIHNAVDIEAIDRILASTDRDRMRRELALEGALVVGTVARLSPEKGIDLLLKAFSSVSRKNTTARLLIVGDGQARDTLKQLARDLELEHRVIWVGRQPWENAMRHMSLMDVVVIPSQYEGFGLTVAEAMACSKPVVAFNLDSLAEVLGPENPSAMVPAGDIEALAGSIASLLGNAELRASAARIGRQRVGAKFGFDLFAKRWLAVYERECN